MEGSSRACHVACTDVPFIPVSHKAPRLAGVKQITQVEHLILHVPLFFQQLSNLLNSFFPLLVPHNHYRKHRKKNAAEARKFLLQEQNIQEFSASANKAEMQNKTYWDSEVSSSLVRLC